jgi:hypothetical protein
MCSRGVSNTEWDRISVVRSFLRVIYACVAYVVDRGLIDLVLICGSM